MRTVRQNATKASDRQINLQELKYKEKRMTKMQSMKIRDVTFSAKVQGWTMLDLAMVDKAVFLFFAM